MRCCGGTPQQLQGAAGYLSTATGTQAAGSTLLRVQQVLTLCVGKQNLAANTLDSTASFKQALANMIKATKGARKL